MDYTEKTKEVYDSFPDYFDEKFGCYSNEIIKQELAFVVNALPKGAKALDLGSGPGNHSLFFQENGLDVLCLDISDEMLKKCHEKRIKTIKMDFEKLNFPEESFDCIWAYTSLLHVPKKKVPSILSSIHTLLKREGYLGISLKEGKEEGFFPFSLGGERWFSLYTDAEIRNLLKSKFNIQKYWRVPIKDKTFLDYWCKQTPTKGKIFRKHIAL